MTLPEWDGTHATRQPAERSALAAELAARRREMSLVEQYLAQTRLGRVASPGARRPPAVRRDVPARRDLQAPAGGWPGRPAGRPPWTSGEGTAGGVRRSFR